MAMVISTQEAALLLERVLDWVSLGREDVMIERPHGQPVVLLPLDEYVTLTAGLVAATEQPDPDEDAEVFSLDARRRHRHARCEAPRGQSSRTAP